MPRKPRALTGNASDAQQVRDARRKETERVDRDRDDLAWLVAQPQGQRFLWRLFETTGITRTAFDRDTNTMYFETGRRDVGLAFLAALMDAAPTAFATMLANAQQETA